MVGRSTGYAETDVFRLITAVIPICGAMHEGEGRGRGDDLGSVGVELVAVTKRVFVQCRMWEQRKVGNVGCWGSAPRSQSQAWTPDCVVRAAPDRTPDYSEQLSGNGQRPTVSGSAGSGGREARPTCCCIPSPRLRAARPRCRKAQLGSGDPPIPTIPLGCP